MEGECFWIKFEESNKILQQLPIQIPIFIISLAIVNNIVMIDTSWSTDSYFMDNRCWSSSLL